MSDTENPSNIDPAFGINEDSEFNEQETSNPQDEQSPSNAQSDDDNIYSIKPQRLEQEANDIKLTHKKNVRKTKASDIFDNKNSTTTISRRPEQPVLEENSYDYEDDSIRKRRLLEEAMDSAVKSKSTRRKRADEDDLERMQDDKIDYLKDQMIKAANMDVEKNSAGQIATEKLKLLKEVSDILSRADLAISILDNNLLEAVRLWLEPLPDASMPAYQIQKELIFALETLPIKTDHLVASGIGKVLVFYQRSKRTEPSLKKIVDRLIGDWTRPILNKSDSYKDRTIQFNDYNKVKYTNQLASARSTGKEAKTLYEENAARRNRAAIPSARTAAYKIAPKVDGSLLRRQNQVSGGGNDERFKKINAKLTSMSFKKKTVKKGGPSIEGRNLAI